MDNAQLRRIDAAVGRLIGQPRPYSTDISASRAMEDWIEGQGPDQIKAYIDELCTEVGYYFRWTNRKLLWNVAHATPMQRCLAFLKAMGVEVPE